MYAVKSFTDDQSSDLVSSALNRIPLRRLGECSPFINTGSRQHLKDRDQLILSPSYHKRTCPIFCGRCEVMSITRRQPLPSKLAYFELVLRLIDVPTSIVFLVTIIVAKAGPLGSYQWICESLYASTALTVALAMEGVVAASGLLPAILPHGAVGFLDLLILCLILGGWLLTLGFSTYHLADMNENEYRVLVTGRTWWKDERSTERLAIILL